ncbi:MAG: ribosome biogenesis GTPase Der [Hyphomicrobiales bacterium]
MTLRVTIVGRPNVGKSTLFNRLAGRRLALVNDEPGVTRDRREADAKLGDLRFSIIDTAGLDEGSANSLEERMQNQTATAIELADIILFMIDARAGVTPMDQHFADMVRKSGKPVILLANKAESRSLQDNIYEAYSLALGDPVITSAEHGDGMSDLYGALLPHAERATEEPELDGASGGGESGENALGPDRPLRLAVIGRPNAGKSTLINQLIGEERLLTGPEAGITRDSISVDWMWKETPVKLFDTAGMRRKAKVTGKLEKLSVADGLRAVRFAEVVVLLLDAEIPFEKQDLQIADLVSREGRSIVIAINKWDIVKNKNAALKEIRAQAELHLPQLRGVELVTLSAKSGKGVDRLMPAVLRAYSVWNTRVSTGQLNRWLEEMVQRHPPPAPRGRRLKLRYVTQVRSRPPSFACFCQRADDVPASYTRYLVNALREDFNMPGTPVRFAMRKGKNPYVKD